jgi:hypothetical protein
MRSPISAILANLHKRGAGALFWKLPTVAVNRTSAIAFDFLLCRFKNFLQKKFLLFYKNAVHARFNHCGGTLRCKLMEDLC